MAEKLELIIEIEEEVEKLKNQIEKMKCCENCENSRWSQISNRTECNSRKLEEECIGNCVAYAKWELKESE